MPMLTFTPPQWPDQNMEINIEPRIIRAQFNDGYAQDAEDGINSDLPKFKAKWTNLRQSEAQTIIDFLRPVAKTREPFWYTRPVETDPVSIKCMKFSYSWKKGNFCDITADFEEAPAVA